MFSCSFQRLAPALCFLFFWFYILGFHFRIPVYFLLLTSCLAWFQCAEMVISCTSVPDGLVLLCLESEGWQRASWVKRRTRESSSTEVHSTAVTCFVRFVSPSSTACTRSSKLLQLIKLIVFHMNPWHRILFVVGWSNLYGCTARAVWVTYSA